MQLLQVDGTMFQNSHQQHGYSNTSQMGKLEGNEELVCDTLYSPIQDDRLTAEDQTNPFIGANELKAATTFPRINVPLFWESKEQVPQHTMLW